MAIKIINRSMSIPIPDRVIGHVGDNLVETRSFELNRYYGEVDLSEFSFKLDTEIDGNKNIIDLDKTVEDDKITLTWTVYGSHVLHAGRMTIQIRAFHDGVEKWHSAQDYVIIRSSINAPDAYSSLLPSEFEQMELRVTTLKEQAEASAQTATEQANRAQSIADEFENETLPAAIAAVEAAVDEQVDIAASHADRAQGIADTFSNTTLPAAISAVEAAGQAKVDLAEAQAIIATTKAQEASDSAAAALASEQATKTYEDNAAGHARTATEQADRAQDIADTFENETLPAAITAVEAAGQAKVDLAEQQANIAAGHAQTAATKAEETSGYVSDAFEYKEAAERAASIATEKAWEAANSAQIAEQQAGIAATKATEAYDSAERAKMSEEAVEGVADEHRLKIAKLEKELNDYKATMQQVNINQEPKQKATGYGIVSLPKNAANGQISDVKLSGVTRTNLVKSSNMDTDSNADGVVDNFTRGVGSGITAVYSLDGTQKIEITDSTSSSNYAEVKQEYIPIKENDVFSACIDVKISGNVEVDLSVTAYDNNNSWLSTIATSPKTTSNGVIKLENLTAPSNTNNVRLTLKVYPINDGDTGIVWVKNAMVEKASSIDTYISSGTKSTVSAMRIRIVSEDEAERSTAYVLAKDEDGNIEELRSLPNGVKDEIRVSDGKLIKRVSDEVVLESDDFYSLVSNVGEEVDYIALKKDKIGISHLPHVETSDGLGRVNVYGKNEVTWRYRTSISSIGCFALGTSELRFIVERGKYSELEEAIPDFVGTKLTYQLAEPVEIPIEVSGNIVSYPSGTIYIERVVPDAGIYTDKMSVLHQDLPIKALEKLSKIDFMTGLETELDVSDAVIAEDKLSFTHPDLVDGDIVFFTYEYDRESTEGETEIEYYDSRYVIKDSVTDKFYKWHIAVADGVPSIELTEV